MDMAASGSWVHRGSMESRYLRISAIVAVVTAGIVVAYTRLVRPWQMNWGATREEVARTLPGDESVPNPTWNATRAVTVSATPEQIWPWLVQIGWGRAGWYGYDWADNGMHPSTWKILPEHQSMEIGKDFPMSPATKMYCVAFDEPRWMLWKGSAKGGTWLWYLDPIDDTHTRLITRMRDRYHWNNPIRLGPQLAVDLFDWPFMRKCMLGVKARAERMARQQVADEAAIAV